MYKVACTEAWIVNVAPVFSLMTFQANEILVVSQGLYLPVNFWRLA